MLVYIVGNKILRYFKIPILPPPVKVPQTCEKNDFMKILKIDIILDMASKIYFVAFIHLLDVELPIAR